MVESVDQGVGRIVKRLDELGLSERTVVFFFSDNGGFSQDGAEQSGVMSNTPLRMGKGHLYEGGIRSPLIVHYPARVRHGLGSLDVGPIESILRRWSGNACW